MAPNIITHINSSEEHPDFMQQHLEHQEDHQYYENYHRPITGYLHKQERGHEQVTATTVATEGLYDDDVAAEEIGDEDCDVKVIKESESSSSIASIDWPLRGIQKPCRNDVLFYGKGVKVDEHPGNERYRKMIDDRRSVYAVSSRLNKPLIALEIIREWRSQDPPGRFLKLDKDSNLWNDMGDKKAREKISQALRKNSFPKDNSSNDTSNKKNNNNGNNNDIGNSNNNDISKNNKNNNKDVNDSNNDVNMSSNNNHINSSNYGINSFVGEINGFGSDMDVGGVEDNSDGNFGPLNGNITSSYDSSNIFAEPWSGADNWLDRLREKLYKRNEEERVILDAYRRYLLSSINANREGRPVDLIVISGPMGTGKSRLAKTLEPTVVHEDSGYFLSCKFHPQLQSSQPQRPAEEQQQNKPLQLLEALEEFIDLMVQRGGQALRDMRYHMYKEMNNHSNSQHQQEWDVLLQMIPSLQYMFDDLPNNHVPTHHNSTTTSTLLVDHAIGIQNNDISNHFVSAIQMLIGVICSSLRRPILLFYKDIQHADASSLSILRSLAKQKIPYLVLVATTTTECSCSSCEEGAVCIIPCNHSLRSIIPCSCKLSGIFQSLQEESCHEYMKIYNIPLRNPTEHFIRTTIQNAMQTDCATRCSMKDDDNNKLCQLFCSQTDGNIFYVIEFLRFLIDENLLIYNVENNSWKCDEQQTLTTMALFNKNCNNDDFTSNLGDFFIYKLRQLPADAKQLLKVASCLCCTSGTGTTTAAATTTTTRVQVKLLQLILPFPVQSIVNELVDKEIFIHDKKRDAYQFRHYAIQEAAYALIEQDYQCQEHDHKTEKNDDDNINNKSTRKRRSKALINGRNRSISRSRSKEFFHLNVGRDLWKALVIDNDENNNNKSVNVNADDNTDNNNTDSNDNNRALLDENVFTLLSQYERGRDFLEDNIEKYAIAALCLHGAKLAVNTSNFAMALNYLNFAINTLLISNDNSTATTCVNKNHNTNTAISSIDSTRASSASMFKKSKKRKQHSSCWRDRYDLTLAIYNAAAEMELVHGNIDNANRYVQEVLDNARINDDKIQAYCSKIYLLGLFDQQQNGLDLGIRVLKTLGETFPIRYCLVRLKNEMKCIRKLLKNITGRSRISDSKELPSKLIRRLEYLVPDDEQKRQKSMQILVLMSLQAALVRPRLAPFVVLKLMKLTLLYGLSIYSSVAFSSYGVLCVAIGDIEEGCRFGMLALELLDRFQVKHYIPRVHSSVYGCTFIWKRPFQDSVQPILMGHRIALQTGDIEFAMVNAHIYIQLLRIIGTTKIDVVESLMYEFCKIIEACNAKTSLLILRPMLQATHLLMGKTSSAYSNSGSNIASSLDDKNINTICLKSDGCNPTKSDDKYSTTSTATATITKISNCDLVVDYENALQHAKETNNATLVYELHLSSMITAYHFSDFEYAFKMSIELSKSRNFGRNPPGLADCIATFFEALTYLELAREKKRNKHYYMYRKFMRKTKNHIKKFEEWSKLCPENFSAMLCLMQADYSSVVAYLAKKKTAYKNNNKAYEKYFAANALCENSKNIPALAMINEHIGYHYFYNMANKGSKATSTWSANAFAGLNDNNDEDDKTKLALPYFQKAVSYYDEWGAKALAQRLLKEVNTMFGIDDDNSSSSSRSSNSSSSNGSSSASSSSSSVSSSSKPSNIATANLV